MKTARQTFKTVYDVVIVAYPSQFPLDVPDDLDALDEKNELDLLKFCVSLYDAEEVRLSTCNSLAAVVSGTVGNDNEADDDDDEEEEDDSDDDDDDEEDDDDDDDEDDDDEEVEEEEDDDDDPDYVDSICGDEESDGDAKKPCRKRTTIKRELLMDDPTDHVPIAQRKYIVYESCLIAMLVFCQVCRAICTVSLVRERGSWAEFEAHCSNGHVKLFQTQPMHGLLPCGNLAIAACSLFTGLSQAQLLRFLKFMHIRAISSRTFSKLQRLYLLPSIRNVWKVSRDSWLQSLSGSGQKLSVGGDARCCTPGHCAKFSSYSIMDLDSSKILDVQLLQVNEVRNSNAMECVGLQRSLKVLLDSGITIASITTDRHPQVQKYLRTAEELKAFSILHFYDVWHIAKSLKKKIAKQSIPMEFRGLLDWKNTVINHLYWCAATSGGDGGMVEEKWLSILSHVVGMHEHSGPLFPQCQHEPLPDNYEYMVIGSAPYMALKRIVTDTCTVRDIRKLSPAGQTSSLESYHNVVISFATKRLHYLYAAMEGRIYLSALHFNENSARLQAITTAGNPMSSMSFPKSRGGEPISKEVKIAATFAYVDVLLTEVSRLRELYPTYKVAEAVVHDYYSQIPKPVASTRKHVDKAELVASRLSRFNK
jgi:hypothetical protein